MPIGGSHTSTLIHNEAKHFEDLYNDQNEEVDEGGDVKPFIYMQCKFVLTAGSPL